MTPGQLSLTQRTELYPNLVWSNGARIHIHGTGNKRKPADWTEVTDLPPVKKSGEKCLNAALLFEPSLELRKIKDIQIYRLREKRLRILTDLSVGSG